jgi:hypothetical protein
MSTRPVAPDHIPVGWEEVNRITNRLAVPGGWIYEIRNAGVVFVPEVAIPSVPRERLDEQPTASCAPHIQRES